MRRLALLLAVSVLAASAAEAAPRKLLVVTVTKGFRHDSIPTAERMVALVGQESGVYVVDFARTDEDLAAKMTPAALAAYDGVVFASTSGDLPLPDRQGFLDWIASGKAFIGLHAASDTFPGFPPYIAMLGGQFDKHGPQVKVELQVKDPKSPATLGLTSPIVVFDEIYQFKNLAPAGSHVVLALDKHPNEGTPGAFPLAWTRSHGKGRVFYTALGHREDVLESEWYRKHLRGGIAWALESASTTGSTGSPAR